MEFQHIPVLFDQCMEGLAIRPEGVYVDATAGGAGHSRGIASRLTTGRLIALDKDPDAVATARERLAPYPCASVLQGDFADLPALVRSQGIESVDGILMDLGVSSYQLDNPRRGFSYHRDAPLDMRMSQSGMSAYDVVNTYSQSQLTRILREYGEEKFAARIAANIVKAREKKPLETTGELAELVRESIPAPARREGGNPAKRTFQAVRIEVNGELDRLKQCIADSFELLAPGGRFAVITFHSLEDRIVKQMFADFARGCTCPPDFPVCVCGKHPRARLVNRKPLEASDAEREANSRSKSAKLRVLERLPEP